MLPVLTRDLWLSPPLSSQRGKQCKGLAHKPFFNYFSTWLREPNTGSSVLIYGQFGQDLRDNKLLNEPRSCEALPWSPVPGYHPRNQGDEVVFFIQYSLRTSLEVASLSVGNVLPGGTVEEIMIMAGGQVLAHAHVV